MRPKRLDEGATGRRRCRHVQRDSHLTDLCLQLCISASSIA
jgi:hypothetical protein